MPKKKKFSKIDYFLFLFDEYRDRLTLVIVLNLLPLIIESKLNDYFKTNYIISKREDFFKILPNQYTLVDFCEVLFYIYIGALIIQLGGSKLNKSWVYIFNSVLLFLVTTYFWSIPKIESLLNIINNGNYVFVFIVLFQLLFYFIFFNKLVILFKKKKKQS